MNFTWNGNARVTTKVTKHLYLRAIGTILRIWCDTVVDLYCI